MKANDVQEWEFGGSSGASPDGVVPEDAARWGIRSWGTNNVVRGFTGTCVGRQWPIVALCRLIHRGCLVCMLVLASLPLFYPVRGPAGVFLRFSLPFPLDPVYSEMSEMWAGETLL